MERRPACTRTHTVTVNVPTGWTEVTPADRTQRGGFTSKLPPLEERNEDRVLSPPPLLIPNPEPDHHVLTGASKKKKTPPESLRGSVQTRRTSTCSDRNKTRSHDCPRPAAEPEPEPGLTCTQSSQQKCTGRPHIPSTRRQLGSCGPPPPTFTGGVQTATRSQARTPGQRLRPLGRQPPPPPNHARPARLYGEVPSGSGAMRGGSARGQSRSQPAGSSHRPADRLSSSSLSVSLHRRVLPLPRPSLWSGLLRTSRQEAVSSCTAFKIKSQVSLGDNKR